MEPALLSFRHDDWNDLSQHHNLLYSLSQCFELSLCPLGMEILLLLHVMAV